MILDLSVAMYDTFIFIFSNQGHYFVTIGSVFIGLLYIASCFYLINYSSLDIDYTFQISMIMLLLSLWFNLTEFSANNTTIKSEDFYLNPTNLVLLLIVISSLLFTYKKLLLYSLFGILNQIIFYLYVSFPLMIIIQKTVLLITFLFFVSLSSIFYYDSIERLKHRTNKLMDQKERIISNRDLINYFLITSSSNLYQPIQQFKSKLANFEESLVINSLDPSYFDYEQNLISIKKNFNVVNFLMQNIQDARDNIIGDSKLLLSEMSTDSLITKFTDFIQQTAFRNHQNIQISINNNIKNSIHSDKEKLLKILINFSKIKLNQETNKLQLEFTETTESNKLFLTIKISNAEQNKTNEHYFPFYNLYLNEFSRNVYTSDQKSVIALENTELLLAFSNQLIMQLNGFLFIEPDNSFIIKIPLLQQGIKHD